MNNETGGRNNVFRWAKTLASLKNRGTPSNVPSYQYVDPKKVTPETMLRIEEKLNPLLELINKHRSHLADKSRLYLQKDEKRSKKGLPYTTPTITVTFVKDKSENIIESDMLLSTHTSKQTKFCHFIFRDGEEMQIGGTSLDNGYNEGILAWVQGGTSIIYKALDDNYIVTTIDYMNNPDGSGEVIEIPK